MTMGVKVYYSEISGSKEVKKRQQRVMMILDSKHIPYEPIDITEPGKESSKDFMLANAKPKGDSKIILSPQIFSDEIYCGDYDDFDLANENDVLEAFLNNPKIEKNVPVQSTTTSSSDAAPAADPPVAENPAENEAEAVAVTNGNAASRESSVDVEEAKTGSGDNKEKSASPERETKESDVVAADTTTTEADKTESTGDETKVTEARESAEVEGDEDEEDE